MSLYELQRALLQRRRDVTHIETRFNVFCNQTAQVYALQSLKCADDVSHEMFEAALRTRAVKVVVRFLRFACFEQQRRRACARVQLTEFCQTLTILYGQALSFHIGTLEGADFFRREDIAEVGPHDCARRFRAWRVKCKAFAALFGAFARSRLQAKQDGAE
eukprot:gnl/Chilomastix_cuspidata/3375.p1 GENE.gnl/Chilomastix_cuspidata/3375~~gnl/Chilomastix_cuspidata/3375.p1  ORF type:complete len:161 (+),score=6.52 gnl/Chilomastix_cuspidata/3375:315-797(+)